MSGCFPSPSELFIPQETWQSEAIGSTIPKITLFMDGINHPQIEAADDDDDDDDDDVPHINTMPIS